ncbi:putative flippase GtrA [Dysgonomonadaceae bacterium PH5-43]|nr:putative flippase GtrA [Dysgonomonadaceae bacterium PH5-43]
MKSKFITQFIKYGIVGVINTLITAVAIWLMLHFVFNVKGEEEASSVAVSVSNIIGYVLGLISSFVLNRSWTFNSQKNWTADFVKFIGVFLICYIPQLFLVMLLNKYAGIPNVSFDLLGATHTITSAYICQLIGMVFYTILNFLCNKYYTFR